jgi:thimet oligopeptidase
MQPEGATILTDTPDAFLAASRAEMDRARKAIASLRQMTAPRDPVIALEAYDDAIAALGDAAARASVCRNAHPDPAMRDAAETCERELDALMTEISLDRNVYDALASIDLDEVDGPTRHYVEKTLREMRRAGVDRDEATRQKVRALRDELLRIGQEFGNHIKDDVRRVELDPSELDGLPADYIASHPPGPNGKVTITTDNTDYVPFITYAKSARAREALWRVYRLRAHPANLEVLDRLLARRHELATLLGYPSWAAYATEDKMIGSADAAAAFIDRIVEASGARCERDYAQLLEQKRKDFPNAERVDAWDSLYYQHRVGDEKYGFDSQAMRPYFEYTRVKEGVLATTAALFGITYRREPEAPRWHPEVEVYDVLDGVEGDGPLLGRIYLDMHPREGKYKHYAQFTLVNGVAGKRLPEGVLMCNFPRPPSTADGAPALMEHDGVRTFFHEFGHLLHHVLGGHTRWAGLSGVAIEWDFVEAPSQMLEEWVWNVPTLQSFARHIETGEPIPAELVAKARKADEYGKGLWVRQQMFYAALSLEYHRRVPGTFDTTALMAELQSKLTPFRYVEDSYFHESFGHLDGYSALYYTYMWSLVIAKDLFAAFGPDVSSVRAREVARRYRERILEPGGSKPAAALVTDFLGRPYDARAYEEWLNAG